MDHFRLKISKNESLIDLIEVFLIRFSNIPLNILTSGKVIILLTSVHFILQKSSLYDDAGACYHDNDDNNEDDEIAWRDKLADECQNEYQEQWGKYEQGKNG